MKRWLLPIGGTVAFSLALWLATTVLDFLAARPPDTFLSVLLLGYADTAKYVLTSIGQSLAAVLGITMMVVLLVVQLAERLEVRHAWAPHYGESTVQSLATKLQSSLLLAILNKAR